MDRASSVGAAATLVDQRMVRLRLAVTQALVLNLQEVGPMGLLAYRGLRVAVGLEVIPVFCSHTWKIMVLAAEAVRVVRVALLASKAQSSFGTTGHNHGNICSY